MWNRQCMAMAVRLSSTSNRVCSKLIGRSHKPYSRNCDELETSLTENMHADSRERSSEFKWTASDIKSNHIPTNYFQKFLLAAGCSYMSLAYASTRPDMIAVLGETTGQRALKHMLLKMKNDKEGSEILRDQPRITSSTVDLETLARMPEGLLGKAYAQFLQKHAITPDSRRVVQFIDDPEEAYVMQRYREVHDLVHTVLNMPINMLGEVAVKWVEGVQTRLPMCVAGALFGPLQFSIKQRQKYLEKYLPWAIQTGFEAHFLMNVYYEKRWEQPVEELLKELNIRPLVLT